jgi:hypothetical protein
MTDNTTDPWKPVELSAFVVVAALVLLRALLPLVVLDVVMR